MSDELTEEPINIARMLTTAFAGRQWRELKLVDEIDTAADPLEFAKDVIVELLKLNSRAYDGRALDLLEHSVGVEQLLSAIRSDHERVMSAARRIRNTLIARDLQLFADIDGLFDVPEVTA